jgi:transcriptional regulator with XRE-family HTH domain
MPERKRTKRIDTRHLHHLARIVQAIVDEHFDGKGARFAAHIGVSQSHISQILRGGRGDRGIGLPVLIALREYLAKTGHPQTLDQMLALDPVDDVTGERQEINRLRQAVEIITSRLDEMAPDQVRQTEIRALPPARRRKVEDS